MDSEVQELKNEMPDAKITSVAGMDFWLDMLTLFETL